jgi:hypothetical protein
MLQSLLNHYFDYFYLLISSLILNLIKLSGLELKKKYFVLLMEIAHHLLYEDYFDLYEYSKQNQFQSIHL